MVYFFRLIALQVELLVAGGTLCVLSSDLTDYKDTPHSLALWTKPCCNVFWRCSDYLLSFSSAHYINKLDIDY